MQNILDAMLGSFCVESSDPSHTCDIGLVQINEGLYIGVTSLPGLVAFLKQDFGMSVDNILSYSICQYPFCNPTSNMIINKLSLNCYPDKNRLFIIQVPIMFAINLTLFITNGHAPPIN